MRTRTPAPTSIDLHLFPKRRFPLGEIRLKISRMDLVDCFRSRLVENRNDPEVDQPVAINVVESERMFRSNTETLLTLTFEIQSCDSLDFILASQRICCIVTDSPPSLGEIEQFK